jgi:hypothetical protein
LAHTEWDVAYTVQSARDTLADMRRGVPLRGLPYEAAFQRDPGVPLRGAEIQGVQIRGARKEAV